MAAPTESVQCFGRKKTAVAVTHCKRGRGLIKINGCPIELVEPEILRFKAYEPILLLGRQRFAGVDMRIRVKGGGHTSQIYAIRQSIAKALVAFYQKYVDEQSKKEIKDILVRYDRTLLVADPRRFTMGTARGHAFSGGSALNMWVRTNLPGKCWTQFYAPVNAGFLLYGGVNAYSYADHSCFSVNPVGEMKEQRNSWWDVPIQSAIWWDCKWLDRSLLAFTVLLSHLLQRRVRCRNALVNSGCGAIEGDCLFGGSP
ncbi:hypothetical protein POTOM_031902 [Populus tomentosa]|uniref:40S ribosomal protein S16 n=1 Tax=Populus tomentosa TaxID=118781 RepID=A0A8X7ZDH6_POPTO|nr:hypothetical protein POTOM_031902 [Populus tomentosa]